MLRFTKRADYGLMAIHYIAVQEVLGPVSAKRIAEQSNIPAELLAKILQRLAKRGLIVSQNGLKGGYVLGLRPTQISVGDVIQALEGPVRIVGCLEESSDCPQLSRCSLRRPVQKLQTAISQMLDGMSLAELTSDDVPEMLAFPGVKESDRWR